MMLLALGVIGMLGGFLLMLTGSSIGIVVVAVGAGTLIGGMRRAAAEGKKDNPVRLIIWVIVIGAVVLLSLNAVGAFK